MSKQKYPTQKPKSSKQHGAASASVEIPKRYYFFFTRYLCIGYVMLKEANLRSCSACISLFLVLILAGRPFSLCAMIIY